MATPLTDSINALTTYANEVTGASDTNLSDAVHTLINGYGQGDSGLWQSVTLAEDHTSDATGSLVYWIDTFLNIISQPDFAQNVWCVVFSNNSASFYGVDFICVSVNENNAQKQASARSKWSDWSTGYARSLYASAGTIINVYKLPK